MVPQALCSVRDLAYNTCPSLTGTAACRQGFTTSTQHQIRMTISTPQRGFSFPHGFSKRRQLCGLSLWGFPLHRGDDHFSSKSSPPLAWQVPIGRKDIRGIEDEILLWESSARRDIIMHACPLKGGTEAKRSNAWYTHIPACILPRLSRGTRSRRILESAQMGQHAPI